MLLCLFVIVFCFCFVKQKTAYEVRISDWSSDVCSSDLVAERALGHKGSLLGACSGAIAGLVAVTPAAGNSGPFGAILLGAIAGIACCWFVMKIKPKLGFDDSLDVFGIHGIGGLIGSVDRKSTRLNSSH